ncbi:MAG TPA: hypothetical protein VFS92_08670, partial [Planctomycetota bacterium]|nr:hypothetical protein [Planctomycetota bacterium]
MIEGDDRAIGPPAGPPHRDGERLVNKVVIARNDGTRFKGYVWDFNPDDDKFHLFDTDDPSEPSSAVLKVPECKALYFVRSLTGNPHF